MASTLPPLMQWVQQQVGDPQVTLQPLHGDASRRCYFRANFNNKTAIVADVSAEKTSLPAFIDMVELLSAQNIIVPQIYAADLVHGYLLEQDFGNKTLLSVLSADNVDALYDVACVELLKMQACQHFPAHRFLCYGKTLLMREWTIFTTWYLQKYRQIELGEHQAMLGTLFELFYQIFIEQPQVLVHRDYHSRNLMLLEQQQLAILDFQGAVQGPITYDLVSLLKDCYITWPESKVNDWALTMQERMWQQQNIEPVSKQQFLRWFDLTGLQRHLKVLGLFARQALAADNDSYLADMPQIMHYVLTVCQRYPELAALQQLLEST